MPAAPDKVDSRTHAGVDIGDTLDGKYRVESVLGAGAMGVVVAAHHLQLDERVAIKFLMPSELSNPEATARFEREARAAVKIKSEHVARVIDVGTLENGAPYIVMELLEGCDLGAWLRKTGPLPVDLAVEFVLQACEAIAEAHALGIIHRDLKPANLFASRRKDGSHCIKVLDFGISKMTHGGSDLAGTRTQAVMGSPSYMSPEQMRSSKDVTAQSDIWSIGIVLHELLTGESPFPGETFPEICVKIATEPPRPLLGALPNGPPRLDAVVSKCLEKDCSRRFHDLAELALALEEFAPGTARASVERIAGILGATARTAIVPAWLDHAVSRASAANHASHAMTLYAQSTLPYGRSTRVVEDKNGWGAALAALFGVLFGGGLATLHGTGMMWREGSLSTRSTVLAQPALNAPSPAAQEALPVVALTPPQSAPASADGGAPRRVMAPTPAPAAAPPRAPRDVPRAAPDCDPPFYFDATGIRIFKKECVR